MFKSLRSFVTELAREKYEVDRASHCMQRSAKVWWNFIRKYAVVRRQPYHGEVRSF